MTNKVLFLGNNELATRIASVTLEEILAILAKFDTIAIDTETNMADSILDRKLHVISIGIESIGTYIVIEWPTLTPSEKKRLSKSIVSKLCLMHSVQFDYAILKKSGIELVKTRCTFTQEMITTTGLNKIGGYHGLADTYMRRFELDISKAEQTTFGTGEPLTSSQVKYAAIDVFRLISLDRQQRKEFALDDVKKLAGGNKGTVKTAWWDNEFLKVASDAETTGVRINKEKWYGIDEKIRPKAEQLMVELQSALITRHRRFAEDNGYVSGENEMTKNMWDSSTLKLLFMERDFPDIGKTATPHLRKYLRENDPEFPAGLAISGKGYAGSKYAVTFKGKYRIVKVLAMRMGANKDKIDQALNKELEANHFEWAVENEIFVPANTSTFSWTSNLNKMEFFSYLDPEIEDTKKASIENIDSDDSIIHKYLEWNKYNYRLNSFGKAFYDKHVDIDGKHRTRFNTVLATGRLSSVKPNLLNVPGESVYRDCFIPDPGFDLIGADYGSQEIVITATLAKETLWLKSVENGWDLHSLNASMTQPKLWKKYELPDCAFKAAHQKCSCPEHKKMRTNAKVVVFSSLYGGTPIRIAQTLAISKEEAAELQYGLFIALPHIRAMMTKFADFAVTHGRIIEPVFGRSRFFPKWKLNTFSLREGIKRQSYNMPIQSAGSAMLKIASVLIRRWIKQNNLEKDVQLLLFVHDELMLQSRPEFTELTKEKVEHYMELAAKLAGFNIKAEALSGDSWDSIH